MAWHSICLELGHLKTMYVRNPNLDAGKENGKTTLMFDDALVVVHLHGGILKARGNRPRYLGSYLL